MARSAALLQALEFGTCRLAGQHQPDALAAAVVAYDVLAHAVTAPIHIVSPIDAARRAREGRLPPPPEWMRRRIGG